MRFRFPVRRTPSCSAWLLAALCALLLVGLAPAGATKRDHKSRPEVSVPPASSLPESGTAVAPAEAKGQQDETPAKAEQWSDAEIIKALADCVRLLAPIKTTVAVSKPIREGQCGAPAPISLKSVGGVKIDPPAVTNCQMARQLHEWVERTLQPEAQKTLGTLITGLVTASGYTCRERIGTSNARISEHAFANALDISAFLTEDGRVIDVLGDWGPPRRERQAAAGPPIKDRPHSTSLEDVNNAGPRAVFLREVHHGACGLFGTVLSPEANAAHRNHLHLDLAHRRHGAYCE